MDVDSILGTGYEDTKAFDICCSNDPSKIDQQKLHVLIQNLAKEASARIEELYTSSCKREDVGIMHGICDSLKAVYSLAAVIEARIGDVSDAFGQMSKIDSLKYTSKFDTALEWYNWYNTEYDPSRINEAYDIHTSLPFEGCVWFCVKRRLDGMIMSPPHSEDHDFRRYLWRA